MERNLCMRQRRNKTRQTPGSPSPRSVLPPPFFMPVPKISKQELIQRQRRERKMSLAKTGSNFVTQCATARSGVFSPAIRARQIKRIKRMQMQLNKGMMSNMSNNVRVSSKQMQRERRITKNSEPSPRAHPNHVPRRRFRSCPAASSTARSGCRHEQDR